MHNDEEKEIVIEPEVITDEEGVWHLFPNGTKDLIIPSEKWFQKNASIQEEQLEPTQEEYMMDLDYRLSLIELGLQEG